MTTQAEKEYAAGTLTAIKPADPFILRAMLLVGYNEDFWHNKTTDPKPHIELRTERVKVGTSYVVEGNDVDAFTQLLGTFFEEYEAMEDKGVFSIEEVNEDISHLNKIVSREVKKGPDGWSLEYRFVLKGPFAEIVVCNEATGIEIKALCKRAFQQPSFTSSDQ